jgi:hypothetical protein
MLSTKMLEAEEAGFQELSEINNLQCHLKKTGRACALIV